MNQEEKNEKLFEAIISEDIPQGAQKAVDDGADINALTNKGASALNVAISRNRRKSFAWLIKNGVDVNIQDNLGETVAMRLARDGKFDYLKYLLDNGKPNLDLANKYGVTALHYASMNSQQECAELLIKSGANVNAQTIQTTTPILAAAQQHDEKIFNSLLDSGASIHDVDYLKQNVLINTLSASPQSLKKAKLAELNAIVERAVKEGIDINYKAPSGNTAIFSALMYGQKEAAKFLIENGVDLDVVHNRMLIDNMNPLHLALESGDAELCSLIIERLKNKNPELLEKLFSLKNSEGNTPAAFGFFHNTTRQLMLDNDADVNTVIHMSDGTKMPIVLVIIQAGDETALDAMITKGVNLHFKEKEFEHIQPIRNAIAMGMPGLVEKIIKNAQIDLNKPIKITEKVSVTPLSFLVSNSKAQILETFLLRKKTIQNLLNQKLGDGSDAYAIPDETRKQLQAELDKYKNIETELEQNRTVILDMLISNGANVNEQDENGRTAVFYCADIDAIKLLIEKGADIFKADNEGNTPLGWAIKNNRPDIIDHLLEYIIENDLVDKPEVQNVLIDIVYTLDDGYVQQGLAMNGINHAFQEGSGLLNNQDEDGNSALIIACATEQAPVANLLINKGADVDLANNAGETALMHAVAHGDEKTVELLIAKGANVNAQNADGKTVFDFAQEVANKDILKLLEKKKEKSFSPK